ncbi:MAG: ABC transporter ATP-binding protein [Parachlamydiaceae bacterium]|nr:ABC transporter ATP-binding protein [Parachlamydiaceae bacterium]
MTQPSLSYLNTLPKFFWHFIKEQWPIFLAMQIFFCGWAIDHTIFPYILSLLIDALVNHQGDRSTIWSSVATPLWAGAILWCILEVSYRLAGYSYARFMPKMEASVRMSMFDYVQRHSYTYFNTKFAGGLANKISDMPNSMARVIQLVCMIFVPVTLALIISSTLFFHLHPSFALILMGWIVVHLGICLLFAKRCSFNSNIHAESRSHLAGKIVDSFTNNLNVRLFSRYNFEKSSLNVAQQDERRKHVLSLKYVERMKIWLSIAAFIGPFAGMTLYIIYNWQIGFLSTGEAVFVFNSCWNVTMMAWIAGLEIPDFFKEVGVSNQALTIVRDAHDIVDDLKAPELKVSRGEIAFENVDFHYIPKHSLFRNKNILIDAGSKVGLVGFSGSGKTTFVHLILRYFDVEAGRILIDGQDIAVVSQNSLRESIAMIPQDASLFHRTLMENIRYGRLDATDEEVIEAARQASCHEFIDKLPEKYNTMAGERGIKLSGGQRQRIAIARAILKNAPILILDEATSALDSVTESHIQTCLEQLILGRTTIVIAHRLSTLSGMDRILVFDEGEIIEDGSHQELLDAQGHYAMMWNMQAGGFLPEDGLE